MPECSQKTPKRTAQWALQWNFASCSAMNLSADVLAQNIISAQSVVFKRKENKWKIRLNMFECNTNWKLSWKFEKSWKLNDPKIMEAMIEVWCIVAALHSSCFEDAACLLTSLAETSLSCTLLSFLGSLHLFLMLWLAKNEHVKQIANELLESREYMYPAKQLMQVM